MFRVLLAHHQETLHECSFGDYCVLKLMIIHNKTSLLTPSEQPYIQSYHHHHHHKRLNPEQHSGDHNPMYRLIYDRHTKPHPAKPLDRQGTLTLM
jgi:hypothetical protein